MARTADDLLTMFRLGKQSQRNFGMQISKKKETPGEGGSPYQPYKPKPSGPYVPAPKRDGLQIAKGFIKHVGEPISLRDATKALHIIKTTSDGNPLKEELRRKRLFKNNPIDINL